MWPFKPSKRQQIQEAFKAVVDQIPDYAGWDVFPRPRPQFHHVDGSISTVISCWSTGITIYRKSGDRTRAFTVDMSDSRYIVISGEPFGQAYPKVLNEVSRTSHALSRADALGFMESFIKAKRADLMEYTDNQREVS